jgi:hypothetical protein
MLFILSAYTEAVAQKTDTIKTMKTPKHELSDKYKIWGTAFHFSDIQDTKMSSMVYSGPGFGLERNLWRVDPKYTHLTNVDLHYSMLLGPELFGSYMHGICMRFNRGILYHLKNQPWKIGGSVDAKINSRIYPKIGNDAFALDFFTGINFSASYSFEFNFLLTGNTLDIQAEIPLIVTSLRYPDYNLTGIRLSLMPIGRFTGLRTKITLIRPFLYSRENRYSIGYEWDFYTFREYDGLFRFVSGNHFFTYSYWLKTM